MNIVENELTLKNIERARNNAELENYNEIERKLVPVNPELVEQLYKGKSTPIEQIYLSNPSDEFSLRVRKVQNKNGENEYTATLKTRGELDNNALRRTEIETSISEEAYALYSSQDLPKVVKQRATIAPGVTVDFYDDPISPVVIEIEHPDRQVREALTELVQESTGEAIDCSNDPLLTSEAIAHRLSNSEYAETPETIEAFTHKVLGEMIAQYVSGRKQVVVGLTGMSGSGKTTVANALQSKITELFGEPYAPIIVSTDDYHFGKTRLEERHGAPYTSWDSAQTYDTVKLSSDLEQLAHGTPLQKRHFDFESEEPVLDGELPLSPFVIVEGLYANSKDLQEVRNLHFELPTGAATSIGRDVRRLIIDNRANRAFPDAPSRLRYQIESALPLYNSLEKSTSRAFSASARPLAERAFMLARYSSL